MEDQVNPGNHVFLFSISVHGTTKSATDNITNFERRRSWMLNHDALMINRLSEDETPLVSLQFYIKLIIIVILTISLLIGSFFKCITYSYVFRANKQNHGWMHRPINVLTVTSSLIHHMTHIWMWIWYVVSMMSETSVSEAVGPHMCQVNQLIGLYGLCYLTVGSLGIAVYRVLYIRHENVVKYLIGEKLLLFIIQFLSLTVCGVLVFVYNLETNSHRFGLNMCRGISGTHAQVLIDYEISLGYHLLDTTHWQTIAVSIVITMQCTELGIYVWFFHHRYTNDNGSIKKVLTEDVIRARNIKNVGTFLGQFYGFVMEYAFAISVLFILYFAGEQKNNFKAVANIAKFIDFGLLSAVEVLSSPALRRYLKSKLKTE
jgi:hypothetical protein